MNQHAFPGIQILTIKELLAGKRPQTPLLHGPYPQATKAGATSEQLGLGELGIDEDGGAELPPA